MSAMNARIFPGSVSLTAFRLQESLVQSRIAAQFEDFITKIIRTAYLCGFQPLRAVPARFWALQFLAVLTAARGTVRSFEHSPEAGIWEVSVADHAAQKSGTRGIRDYARCWR